GQGPATTIPVQVKLTDPRAGGTLDQAPGTVNITTASSGGPVLAVPEAGGVAPAEGGGAGGGGGAGARGGRGGTRRRGARRARGRPGILDDVKGLVQVTGKLTPGERVVVASS